MVDEFKACKESNFMDKPLISHDLTNKVFLSAFDFILLHAEIIMLSLIWFGWLVNLYQFYQCTQKLGGYNEVTEKRLWKHVYDQLGGSPGNTSAATGTRRNYEK